MVQLFNWAPTQALQTVGGLFAVIAVFAERYNPNDSKEKRKEETLEPLRKLF